MTYEFLIQTYETEIQKVLSTWATFNDDDLDFRPHESDARGRSFREQLVHQCVSENLWFSKMLGIRVVDSPLPENETRIEFMGAYSRAAQRRLDALCEKDDAWWQEEVDFFGELSIRAWVMVRRIAHTAHHRGQQTTMLRMLSRDLHSTYGPTADTGGLMQDHAPTLYPYPDIATLLAEESGERRKAGLPPLGPKSVTERPAS